MKDQTGQNYRKTYLVLLPMPRPPPRPRPLPLPRPDPKYTTDKVRHKYSYTDRRHYRYLLVLPLVPVHKQTSRPTLIDN